MFGLYVLAFFLPQVIKGFQQQFDQPSFSLVEIGLITAIPYAFATVAMVLWARHSDRTGERAGHVAVAAFVGAVAIAAALYMNSPVMVMVCVTVCAMGVFAAIPVFWQLPNMFLAGVGAAAGIGLINSFGNLSGFVGPYLTGWLQGMTDSFRPGMWVVAGFMALAGLIVLSFRTTGPRRRDPRRNAKTWSDPQRLVGRARPRRSLAAVAPSGADLGSTGVRRPALPAHLVDHDGPLRRLCRRSDRAGGAARLVSRRRAHDEPHAERHAGPGTPATDP